jgi:hypothetical protein
VDALDDRPYLAAHGDGVVHLLVNTGNDDVPAPASAAADPTAPHQQERIWAYTSTDGGMTWSLGWGFAGETFCAPAADPADTAVVTVACERGAGTDSAVTVYRSADTGATFRKVWSTGHRNGPGYLTPWPAMDAAGWGYAAWLDDRVDWSGLQDVAWGGNATGRVMLARSADGAAWQALDVTPFAGRFGMIHASAGPAGVVAITFHATTDLAPNNRTEWHGYALVTPDARAPRPEWHLALLDPRPTEVGPIPPRDFFQNAVGPDGRVHVALQHDRPKTAAEQVQGNGIPADILYVGQATGPNVH